MLTSSAVVIIAAKGNSITRRCKRSSVRQYSTLHCNFASNGGYTLIRAAIEVSREFPRVLEMISFNRSRGILIISWRLCSSIETLLCHWIAEQRVSLDSVAIFCPKILPVACNKLYVASNYAANIDVPSSRYYRRSETVS